MIINVLLAVAARSAAFSGSRTLTAISETGIRSLRKLTTCRPICPLAPVTTIICFPPHFLNYLQSSTFLSNHPSLLIDYYVSSQYNLRIKDVFLQVRIFLLHTHEKSTIG